MNFKIKLKNKLIIEKNEDKFLYENTIQCYNGHLVFITFQKDNYNEGLTLTKINDLTYECTPCLIMTNDDNKEISIIKDINTKTLEDIMDEFIAYYREYILEYTDSFDICKKLLISCDCYLNDPEVSEDNDLITCYIDVTKEISIKFIGTTDIYNNLSMTGVFVENENKLTLDEKNLEFTMFALEYNLNDYAEYIGNSSIKDIIEKII